MTIGPIYQGWMMARRFTRNAKSQPRKARTRCGKSAPEHGQLAVKSTANMGIADMTNPTQEAVEAVRFDDCPEGLFWFGQHLGFMTEYATAAKDGFRQRDAYVVESGEYFWGGTSDPRKRAELLVFPVEDPVAALRPAGDSGEVAVKALEWNDNNIGVSYADTPFGRYRATNSGWWFGADHLTYAPSKEAAKSAAQADYDRRIRSALAAPVRSPDAVTLETYYARQIEWSRDTFGPALRTKGAIDHIRKELAEIEADPHDLSEWVDVIILAMDGFWRHGGTAESLMPALLAKQAKNMARAWPDWRTMSEDRAIEHDRSGDALSSPQPPDPAAVRVTHEVTDLLTEVGRMPADFPNYADWSVTLPAGHWRALSAALASARPEGWRTMNSAPRDGTRILATGGGLNSRVDIVEYLPNVGAWEGNGYVFDDCDDEPDSYSRPSHWMPLPAAPAEEVKL